jgi:hypothetical protein
MQLHMKVEISTVLGIGPSSSKIEVDLMKYVPSRWQGLGEPLDHHHWFGLVKVISSYETSFFLSSCQDLPLTYRCWTVSSLTCVTPDTRHIVLDPPQGTLLSVPTGPFHYISAIPGVIFLCRPPCHHKGRGRRTRNIQKLHTSHSAPLNHSYNKSPLPYQIVSRWSPDPTAWAAVPR